MLRVRYKRGFLRVLEVMEYEQMEKATSIDLAFYSKVVYPFEHQNMPLRDREGRSQVVVQHCKTLLIDLRETEEAIFQAIHKNTRYKINRARKRDLISYYEVESPTDADLHRFCTFYNSFAKQKKIPPANIDKLQGLRDQQSIILTYITDEDDRMLCCHIHYLVKESAVLLYSASGRFDNAEMRNIIGRANRYLHWRDMLSFKAKGIDWYNFGGLFVDPSSSETSSINRFKKEFGGIEVNEWKLLHAQSFLGRLVAFAYRMKICKRPEYVRAKMVF
ncbi:peptidoglycan bridge formation glycyltransferase FemA/FemB family protein [Ornithinibacillus sp. BX22]|uniref:Lipid II:glycine glycyltransferase n=2 Tax=Ornithinibacillus TaxID=484508 RepID=A0A923L7M4_9BACI|nr:MULTISPECIES: peptidoglycan bridge formation glycyltransferase FemA/FemB family protein [Ornithinibacillus]MBC5637996.1 peptidoglycan bridge formation glycyltransferase FemA/FemB family protein [Ornithinibacillus hominis]MBS3681884.1 peptidoglycan bridge formation glycyltransferase FemA/FemB family protein [Ornithinibacillus massiliensis]